MPEEISCSAAAGEPNKEAATSAPIQTADKNVPAVPSGANPNQNPTTAEKLLEKGERWLIGIGVATLLVNILIAWIYFGQLQEMVGAVGQTDDLNRQYRFQSQQLAKQAKETHDLAVAADKQATQALSQSMATRSLAQTSKEALVSVQRAFIFATGFDGIRMPDPNDPNKIGSLEFSVTLENSGTTPTRDMQMHYSWLTPDMALPDSFPYPDLGDGKNSPVALGPRGIAHTTPIQIPAPIIAKIIARQSHLYIWGWTRYRDVFPNSKPHITRFCTEITGFQGDPLNPNANAISRPVLQNCGSNCYDDECKVQ